MNPLQIAWMLLGTCLRLINLYLVPLRIRIAVETRRRRTDGALVAARFVVMSV